VLVIVILLQVLSHTAIENSGLKMPIHELIELPLNLCTQCICLRGDKIYFMCDKSVTLMLSIDERIDRLRLYFLQSVECTQCQEEKIKQNKKKRLEEKFIAAFLRRYAVSGIALLVVFLSLFVIMLFSLVSID